MTRRLMLLLAAVSLWWAWRHLPRVRISEGEVEFRWV